MYSVLEYFNKYVILFVSLSALPKKTSKQQLFDLNDYIFDEVSGIRKVNNLIIKYFNIFPRSNSTDTTDQGMCTILLYNATTLDQVKVLWGLEVKVYGGWRLKFYEGWR